MKFTKGAANEKHQRIAERVRDAILNKFLSRELTGFQVEHCEETGLTFVIVTAAYKGSNNPSLEDRRHFVIRERGGLSLLNGKNKSRDRANGFHNVVWAVTKPHF